MSYLCYSCTLIANFQTTIGFIRQTHFFLFLLFAHNYIQVITKMSNNQQDMGICRSEWWLFTALEPDPRGPSHLDHRFRGPGKGQSGLTAQVTGTRTLWQSRLWGSRSRLGRCVSILTTSVTIVIVPAEYHGCS